ncbi:unnamed protein product, partial [Gulo gulo]
RQCGPEPRRGPEARPDLGAATRPEGVADLKKLAWSSHPPCELTVSSGLQKWKMELMDVKYTAPGHSAATQARSQVFDVCLARQGPLEGNAPVFFPQCLPTESLPKGGPRDQEAPRRWRSGCPPLPPERCLLGLSANSTPRALITSTRFVTPLPCGCR